METLGVKQLSADNAGDRNACTVTLNGCEVFITVKVHVHGFGVIMEEHVVLDDRF